MSTEISKLRRVKLKLMEERDELHQELSDFLSSNASARQSRRRKRMQSESDRKQQERHSQRLEQLQAKLDELTQKQKAVAGKHKLRQQRDALGHKCSRLKDERDAFGTRWFDCAQKMSTVIRQTHCRPLCKASRMNARNQEPTRIRFVHGSNGVSTNF